MNDVPGFASGEREPRWDRDADIGYQGQLYVEEIIDHLKNGYGEVKTDDRAAVTGNVFIEHECRTLDGWGPSGILTTQAAVWTFVIGRTIALTVPTDLLYRVWELGRAERGEVPMPRGSHPTKGVLVPIPTLIKCILAEAAKRVAA